MMTVVLYQNISRFTGEQEGLVGYEERIQLAEHSCFPYFPTELEGEGGLPRERKFAKTFFANVTDGKGHISFCT